VSAVGSALPLFATRYPPFTDLPEHVAAIATLAKLLPGGGGAPTYDVALGSSQYLLYHAVGALLARLFGDPILGHRVLLACVALAWPLSLRALLRALGRDPRLALFGCMAVWNRALLIGFLPFFASVPLALFALASVVRYCDRPRLRGGLALVVLPIALFYTHVSSFVVFGAAAAVMVGVRRRWSAVLPLLPSLACAFLWWRVGALENGSGQLDTQRLPLGTAISAMPVWTFEIWRSHVDDLCATVWWTAFLALLVMSLRGSVTRAGALALVPFACTLVVYLVTPLQVGTAGYVNVRLAPVLSLFAILGLEPRKGRAGDVPLVCAAVAALVMAGDALYEMRRLADEELGDLDALLAHARPGSRLVMLNYELTSQRVALWPYVFAGSYHRAKGGDVAGYSFTELSHWPLHYAPGAAPPTREPFWVYGPCAYRYRGDGEYYDYVLVHGRVDPFAEPAPGPRFSAVARSRAFTLFEKTSSPGDTTTPDHGPCATQ
jgi:hypothetical protein